MNDRLPQEYVLGLDLGSNSLGWAMIGREPAQLLRAGARVFEAGMDGDIQSGREESRNLKRREARLHRRLLWRRRRRLTKLFNLLQRFSLLPAFPVELAAVSGSGHKAPLLPDQTQDYFNNLDKEIVSSEWFKVQARSGQFPEPEHTMPYILRASALDGRLEPHVLGRALYHLAQRRGFLSNRKQVAKKKDDDEGAVKEGIAELRKAMQQGNVRTLGEYLSHLSPAVERIRCRWTARDMYEKEFNAIWDAQSPHHPDLLTADRKKQTFHAIFYQRPLRFDRNAIGKCELEPGERRAPRSSFVAQRFRLLQAVNNLRLELPDGAERPLTVQERSDVVQELELKGDRTFAQVRKLLNLPRGARFTIEEGGEKNLPGNRTTSKFYGVFGERWLEMSAEEHGQALQDVLSIQKEDALVRRAVHHWKLDEETAKKFAKISPEPDYFSLSRRAIEKLMPLLETGVTYAEARKQAYPESFETGEAKPLLPPVEMALPEIRNPAVTRSLTELRKVVNALVRQEGKPTYVHVEMARDLKKSRKQRQAISDSNRQNEKARAKSKQKIFDEMKIKDPKPDDIRRVLLAEECHWTCPYTGKPISMRTLFGSEPQFDIEHIIPFSRSMDNSFQNLTLCYVAENRSAKGNKTPWEAYHGNPDRYEAMLDRVRKFAGDRRTVAAKLNRFTMTDEELQEFLENFRNRQLNDTAYATALAAKYLGLLYGGVVDVDGRRRVQATSGQSTSYFRGLWKLNSILNDGPTANGGVVGKSRDDHRHHAVDAVVIGLTDAAMIKRLSDAAQRAPLEHRRRFASLKGPWSNFTDSVRSEIDKIVVSHRVSKKVSGALHEESIYSPPKGERGEVRIRKPLASLTKPEVEKIADDGVKKLVQRKLEELGEAEPKKAFSNPENLPVFPSSNLVIKKVRISKALPTRQLGEGRTARRVTSESNHHVEIYAEIDERGNEGKWGGEVVSMSEAYQRLKAGKPIVQREFAPHAKFKFSLAPGEVIECDDGKGSRKLLVVRSVSQFTSGQIQIGLVPVNDARKKAEIIKSKDFIRPGPATLIQMNVRKFIVSPLGEVREAHD